MRSSEPERNLRTAPLRLLLLLLVPVGVGGCQHVIEPPATVSDPVRVFVVDYGRHASLALPTEAGAGLVECCLLYTSDAADE